MYAFLIDNALEIPEHPVYYCVLAADIKRMPLADCYDDMGNRIGTDAGDIMADAITFNAGYHLRSLTVWQSRGHSTHLLIDGPETVAMLARAILDKTFSRFEGTTEVFHWREWRIELVPGAWYRAKISYL